MTREFRPVPFNPAWPMGKLDLHAIYQRENGDYTSPLPVRRHLDWLGKGFTYVTLADAGALQAVAGQLRAQGYDPRDFVMGPNGSPWNPALVVTPQAAPEKPAPVKAEAAAPKPKRPRGRPRRGHVVAPQLSGSTV